MEQVCLRVLRCSNVRVVPPVLPTHISCVYHRHYIGYLNIDSVVKENSSLAQSVSVRSSAPLVPMGHIAIRPLAKERTRKAILFMFMFYIYFDVSPKT